MRGRQATLMVAAVLIAAGIVGFACGFEEIGGRAVPEPGGDSSPLADAAAIPRADAEPDADGGADASRPAPCPVGQGAMVLVDAGALVFCIDATEVTNASYDAFLAATDGGQPGALDASVPDGCAANLSFARSAATLDAGTYPATNIDWCDAHAFCSWAGKRLCGKLVSRDASTGEWFNACSKGGTRPVPYGPAYVPGTCNDTGGAGPDPVGSHPGCEGSLPGIYDMNGNVEELVDSCGPTSCTAMGGDYGLPTGCAIAAERAKDYASPAVGFRCCADPK